MVVTGPIMKVRVSLLSLTLFKPPFFFLQVLLILVVVSAWANCELPPIYNRPHTYRPNPQVDFNQQSLDVKIPPKFTIEQLIRLTEQLQSDRFNGQRIQVNLVQGQNLNQLKPPSAKPAAPWQNFKPGQPDKNQWVPQPYPTPSQGLNRPLKPPSTSYGVPNFGGVETFEDDSNKQQNLPYNKPPVVFRPTQEYIPPQTTPRGPAVTSTTPRATESPELEPFDNPATQVSFV